MQVDKVIGSKIASAYYQLVRIGNVEILMVKGEAVAFQAPGFGCLTSMACRSATLVIRGLSAFQWRPTAEITGGSPFTECLTQALKSAFSNNEIADNYNKQWFANYRHLHQVSYRTLLTNQSP